LREKSTLESQLNSIKNAENSLQDFDELIEIAKLDEEIKADLYREMQQLADELSQQEVNCLFSEAADSNSCFMEIHSGAGGTESDDWAAMLLRMYSRWVENNHYRLEEISTTLGDEAGIKSITLRITGEGAYGWLRTESGVHRLVRQSPFNSAGKRHTSFASVWVYPVVDDNIDITIAEKDLRIDTYRSSGAGGQHVNTTDSAVRITHIPTGIKAQSQNNRSQHRNREECILMLKSRLYEFELQKKLQAINASNDSKKNIGWGNQIRSYVLHPYQMVKDLRSNHESSNTKAVLDGDLNEFILATLKHNLQQKNHEKTDFNTSQ